MSRKILSGGTIIVWILALIVAIFSARYFLVPPPMLNPPALNPLIHGQTAEAFRSVGPYLYSNHRALLLAHIGGGIVALALGLFQFVGWLRKSRPALHRLMGMIYIMCVLLSGMLGFPLSFMMFEPVPPGIREEFHPMLVGLASLSVVWPATALIALWRARQRRFADHRAWMIRGYSLTFAAPTARILAPFLLLTTGSFVFALNATFLSWPLNLMVAELVVRRETERSTKTRMAPVVAAEMQADNM